MNYLTFSANEIFWVIFFILSSKKINFLANKKFIDKLKAIKRYSTASGPLPTPRISASLFITVSWNKPAITNKKDKDRTIEIKPN